MGKKKDVTVERTGPALPQHMQYRGTRLTKFLHDGRCLGRITFTRMFLDMGLIGGFKG
jgi:hypothetical protein